MVMAKAARAVEDPVQRRGKHFISSRTVHPIPRDRESCYLSFGFRESAGGSEPQEARPGRAGGWRERPLGCVDTSLAHISRLIQPGSSTSPGRASRGKICGFKPCDRHDELACSQAQAGGEPAQGRA